ncbi:MAG: glycosyltransferase family 2 protein [Myxococcales bacterium]|nr:MAG: glycosyltransferase family 2 protein [Myxococcales bacterium]
MNVVGTSIVIPAHDEAERLPATLRRMAEFAATYAGLIKEVVIVDDGSRDTTRDVAETFSSPSFSVRVVSYHPNAGKGYAIRRGVMVARGDAVLLFDADSSTPIEELVRFLPLLGDADVLIGSRAVDESLTRVRQRWYRQGMGRIFNQIARVLTRVPFQDTQCGFKLMRGEVARRIFERATIDRFAFDVEMIILASVLGYSVAEVPVVWSNSPDSRVRILRDSFRMLVDVLRIRVRHGTWCDAAIPPPDSVRSARLEP